MKVSRERVAEHRRRILDTAGTLFRERGFAGVGVADIMHAAGLTHGGFYGHFRSKDELAAEALAHALASKAAVWEPRDDETGPAAFARFVTAYLSAEHRDHPGSGCALAALGSEAARSPQGVRGAFTAAVASRLQRLTATLRGRGTTSEAAARANAVRVLSTSVGALVLARAVNDPDLSDEILGTARTALLDG